MPSAITRSLYRSIVPSTDSISVSDSSVGFSPSDGSLVCTGL